MKRIFLLLSLLAFVGPAAANTTTTNYSLNKPAVNDPADEDLWGTLLNANFDTIDTALDDIADDVAVLQSAATGIPIGTVTFYAGTSAPTDWLLGYGQAVSRVTYDDLFTAIGTTYGTGDGSTTFNVPDCRGRVLAGQDDMGGSSANRLTDSTSQGIDGDVLGDTGGEESHTMTVSELASHTHSISTDTSPGSGTEVGNAGGGSNRVDSDAISSAGSSAPFNVVQPTLILNCIIYAGE